LSGATVLALAGLLSAASDAVAQVTGGYERLPAEPPIGGPVWTVVVPGVLLLGASAATWLLYRHFAGPE
jgi:hypothetical protein